jgi:hypothetical protein
MGSAMSYRLDRNSPAQAMGCTRADCAETTNPAGEFKAIDQSGLPVFQQDWWVRIARGAARYFEARVLDDGVVVGILPYIVERRKFAIRRGGCPSWSHLGGPVVSQALSDAQKASVLRRLIAQLPRNIAFEFACSPVSKDIRLIKQAFFEAGFDHSTQPTYSQPPEAADVMGRLKAKHRNHITSADRTLDVRDIDADAFIHFYEANTRAAGLKCYAPLGVAHALVAEGRGANPPQVRVIAASRKTDGVPGQDIPLDAAIACAWDNERYYFWMATRRYHTDDSRHEKPHVDAIKLLIVKAMAHARDLRLTFDADGINNPGAEKLFRDLLKMPNMEERDVFKRPTIPARLYEVGRRLARKAEAI